MDNRTITLQELLEYMSMLRDDMNALTVAFSYLASSLPKETDDTNTGIHSF